jgi:hypothetical protein
MTKPVQADTLLDALTASLAAATRSPEGVADPLSRCGGHRCGPSVKAAPTGSSDAQATAEPVSERNASMPLTSSVASQQDRVRVGRYPGTR